MRLGAHLASVSICGAVTLIAATAAAQPPPAPPAPEAPEAPPPAGPEAPPPTGTAPSSAYGPRADAAMAAGELELAGLYYLRAFDEAQDPRMLLRSGVAFLKVDTAAARAASVQALRRYAQLATRPEEQQHARELLRLAEARLDTPLALPSAPPTVGPPAPAELPARDDADAGGDPNPGRIVYVDAAYLPPAGTFSWRSLNLGLHQFGYTVHEYVELGASTIVPAGAVGILPEIKVAGLVAEPVSLGAVARAGVVGFFFEDMPVLYAFGGGVMASFGVPDLHVTVGNVAYGAGTDEENDLAYIVFPHVGVSARVATAVKLNLELGPAFLGAGDEVLEPGKIWPIIYGARFHGSHFYGDVGFIIPASEGWFDEIAKYLPLGIPLLTFGYSG